jgi:hypothetical protein
MTYSPDTNHLAQLINGQEIRFGPCSYNLIIDNKEIPQLWIGEHHVWSDDSEILVVQEWLSENPLETRPVFINPKLWEIAFLKSDLGWTKDFYFHDLHFYYKSEISRAGGPIMKYRSINRYAVRAWHSIDLLKSTSSRELSLIKKPIKRWPLF